MAVGIFDSGLGGLTILDAISKRLPDVPFVYLGDNANAPYGVRSAEDIFNLTCAATERLWAEGCDLVILACNTASAAAILGSPRLAVYSATKFAVRGLSEALDIEFQRHGVRVTCLMPYFIETPILDNDDLAKIKRLEAHPYKGFKSATVSMTS